MLARETREIREVKKRDQRTETRGQRTDRINRMNRMSATTANTKRMTRGLLGDNREVAIRSAEDLLREVRNRSAALRLHCGGALMPAQAMHPLESARDEIERLMRGKTTV